MAMGFRRTLTFASPKAGDAYRARSTSLPGRFHPLVSHLDDSVQALVPWKQAQTQAHRDADWIADGVTHLARLLSRLSDLLHHPQALDPLRRRRLPPPPWAERLLDDLLRLADSHGCFRDALVGLKQLHSETHSALRRRDAARLAAALRSHRRADRDLSRLAAATRDLSRNSTNTQTSDAAEAAIAAAMENAMAAVATASAALFAGVAAASAPWPAPQSPTSVATAKVWWVGDLLRWRRRTRKETVEGEAGVCVREEEMEAEEKERKKAMEMVRKAEDCVAAAESGCDDIYRALVNARVSLLNILTPSF